MEDVGVARKAMDVADDASLTALVNEYGKQASKQAMVLQAGTIFGVLLESFKRRGEIGNTK